MTTEKTTVSPASIPLRPLGLVKNIVDQNGLDVTYVYEDLVFIEHNAFLLQMGAESGADLLVWFNTDSDPEAREEIFQGLAMAAQNNGMRARSGGTYTMASEEESDAFQLHFTPL
ncbi:MAG: hypothetical protein ACK5PS_17250 [Desulfopila sp.]